MKKEERNIDMTNSNFYTIIAINTGYSTFNNNNFHTIGNVEIGKASGSPINRDVTKANEVTRDEHHSTNVNVESQTIEYATNPGKLKEALSKIKDEIKDVTKALDNSIHDPGDDNRNFFGQLRETRLSETVNNIAGERLKVAQTRKEIASAFEEAYSDLGYKNVRVIFTTPEHASQLIDENGKPKAGTAYINKKTGEKTIFINENADENQTKTGLIGVIAEEGSHIINGVEGRQIETGTEEKGLESTGRATNEYFQEKYKDDADKLIIHKSDGIDYSGVDFGENVGDKIKVYYAFGTLEAGYLIVGKFTAIVGYAVGDKGAPQYFITFSGGGGLGLGTGGSIGGGFTYLENKNDAKELEGKGNSVGLNFTGIIGASVSAEFPDDVSMAGISASGGTGGGAAASVTYQRGRTYVGTDLQKLFNRFPFIPKGIKNKLSTELEKQKKKGSKK